MPSASLDSRKTRRVSVTINALVYDETRIHEVRVKDLSATGCRIQGATVASMSSPVTIDVLGHAVIVGAEVMWRREASAGLRFLYPPDKAPAEAEKPEGAPEPDVVVV